MNPDDHGPADDDFTSWAVACHESVTAGRPAEPPATDPSLRKRQAEFQTCLRRLERLRRARQDVSTRATLVLSAAHPAGPTFPATLGRFRLVRVLGSGSFGIVYLASDPRLGRQVALKVPRPGALLTAELRQRFVREAWAAARLSHPHILPVYESDEAGPICFLVTLHCAGGSLASWPAHRQEPLPPRAAAALTVALADAVQHAHVQGVLHRDLKPGNVLLEPLGDDEPGLWEDFRFRPRVGDFGLAKFLQAAEEEGTRPTCSLVLLGTPAYMAPEQADGRRGGVGPAADIYALGAILYELLTGRPPFESNSALETLRRVTEEEPVPPRRLRRDVPRDLEAICLKCLGKSPDRRYASAAAMADDLQRFLAGLPTRARPVGAWSHLSRWCRRHWAAASLLAVAACSLLSLSGGLYWHEHRLSAYEGALLTAQEQQRSITAAAEEERGRTSRLQDYGARVRLAAGLWAEGKPHAAAPVLAPYSSNPGPDDVRGFEWRYLWRVGGLRLLRGAGEGIHALAFSPDGRTCASAGSRTLQLWDVRSSRSTGSWEEMGTHPPYGPVLASDGRRLVGRKKGEESTVFFWDTVAGQATSQCTVAAAEAWQAAVSPDGRTVALGGSRPHGSAESPETTGLVRLWDTRSGGRRVVWQRPGSNCNVTALGFAPGGDRLAVGYYHPNGGPCVDLVDLAGSSVQATLRGHAGFIRALVFSPRGAVLASSDRDGVCKLWDAATGQEQRTLRRQQSVSALAFSPDGRTIAVGTHPVNELDRRQASVTLWDVASGAQRQPELNVSGGVAAVAYAPDGRTLAVGCGDEVIRLWEPEPPPAFLSLSGHQPREAWAVALTPDGKTLVSAGDDHAVRRWDVAAGSPLAVLEGHDALVTCVAVSPDGKRIASGSFDKTLAVWDAETGKVVFRGEHAHVINRVAFSPDSRLVASSDRDRTVRVWDVATGAPRATLPDHHKSVRGLAFVGPGLLASGDDSGTVRLWDVGTCQTLRVLQDDENSYCLAVSPDGKTLAAGNKAGLVKLWDTYTGRELRVLRGHTRSDEGQGGIRSVAFSPDGRTLASAGEDKTIRLWQVATGLELLCLKGQPHFVNGVAFSPDGKHLAAALHDGSLRLWQADTSD
jgi:WD40 repeat protein/serine/threonine protein kinase